MDAWAVTVDDPDMAGAHELRVEANDERGARLEGARRAIIADRRGSGHGIRRDDGNYVMPPRRREDQAHDDVLVGKVADFALARRVDSRAPTA